MKLREINKARKLIDKVCELVGRDESFYHSNEEDGIFHKFFSSGYSTVVITRMYHGDFALVETSDHNLAELYWLAVSDGRPDLVPFKKYSPKPA